MLLKFFALVQRFPHNKQNYVKNFDEFYFTARPRFTPKAIGMLFFGEGIFEQCGLFSIIANNEQSLLSAATTAQLLSKMLDFQKNIHAEALAKGLGRREPS